VNRSDAAEQVRRVVPLRMIPSVVRRRVDQVWEVPAIREGAEEQMRWLLEFTDRAPEIPQLARGYLEQMMLRYYLRWHPRVIFRQRVEGVEWITTKRDPSRAAVVSFMHHGNYHGFFASARRAGAPIDVVMSPDILDRHSSAGFRQYGRLILAGSPNTLVAGVGIERIAEAMRPGVNMGIATDVPSRTEVTFLGRRGRGAFGAARIAHLTDSLVVPLTLHRDASGSFLRFDEPIDPRDHAGPEELQEAMLRHHEPVILAWPEALDAPKARFAPLDADDAANR
jgi:lauroyl/myristoyl acyltransferase